SRFSLHCFCHLPTRHSFPTRRSSDLYSADFFTGRITRKPVSKTGRRIEKGCGSRPKAQSSVGPWGTEIVWFPRGIPRWLRLSTTDRKSTRLNSSHVSSSYAVFCLKKK